MTSIREQIDALREKVRHHPLSFSGVEQTPEQEWDFIELGGLLEVEAGNITKEQLDQFLSKRLKTNKITRA